MHNACLWRSRSPAACLPPFTIKESLLRCLTAIFVAQNEAAAIRAKIQDSIVLLQLGLTIWSRKQNETSARERATELATELTKQIRSSAETVAERIEATNLRREEQVAAERKAETEARLAQDLQRKRSEASADALLELCIEQLKQRTAAQTHVRADTQTSTEEHKTTPAKIGTVDAILMRLSAPFMRVTEEGAKVREVSFPRPETACHSYAVAI